MKKQKNYQTGSAPIYMRITVNGKRAEVSAGRDCEPDHWNSHAGRAIGTKEDVRALDAYLESLQSKVNCASPVDRYGLEYYRRRDQGSVYRQSPKEPLPDGTIP